MPDLHMGFIGKKFLSEMKRISIEIAEKTVKKFPIKILVELDGL